MGADGGTIPTRGDQVKLKQKEQILNEGNNLSIRWSSCALTALPLNPPICADMSGNLFNWESVIECLLAKSKKLKPYGIRSKNDVVKLQIKVNPKYQSSLDQVISSSIISKSCGPFVCPLSGLETIGRVQFVAIRECGHVFSARALKEVSSGNCPQCEKSFEWQKLITLIPTEEYQRDKKSLMTATAAQ